MWTAALKSSATNVRRGCARAFMYDGLWETDVENLRTFVGSIVNDAHKAKNHRYQETHPWQVGSQTGNLWAYKSDALTAYP